MSEKEKEELTDLEKAQCLTGRTPGGIVIRNGHWGAGKRRRAIFEDRSACYHVMSRTTGGDLLFGQTEKEAFVVMMRRLARFAGIEVLTFAVMGNHFHLLLRVPEKGQGIARFLQLESGERAFVFDREVEVAQRPRVDEEKLLEHLKLLYSKAYLRQLEAEIEQLRTMEREDLIHETLWKYLDRMCHLPGFVKELKERFSRWFNKTHGRRGTLWMDRYKCVLVEDGEALRTMAAYIDLNPLRAGLVEDPKDYRWCGYAEAVAGSKRARRGICRALGLSVDHWTRSGAEIYRCLLLTDGMERVEEASVKDEKSGEFRREVRVRKRGFSREEALAQLEKGGRLEAGQLLRCRVRYFSDGIALGSREFVEEVFQRKREWFGEKRETGARALPMKLEGESSLFSLRDLKVKAVE